MSLTSRGLYKRFLKCPSCGKVNEMWAKRRYTRPKGHIKTMQCYFCGEYVDMTEISEWDLRDST